MYIPEELKAELKERIWFTHLINGEVNIWIDESGEIDILNEPFKTVMPVKSSFAMNDTIRDILGIEE